MSFEQVGTTAFVIAAWRAEELNSPAPVCLDHLAGIFINDEMRKLAGEVALASPSTAYLVKFRTRYFDDLIISSIEEGIRQIIILGAGLDTRSIRLGRPDVQFYEIDQEHVLGFKRQKLQEYQYHMNSRYISCDYTNTDFIALLEEQGVDFTKKTLFLWEGNIFYLPLELNLTVLSKIKNHFSEVQISFDYLSFKLIQRATGFNKSNDLLLSFSNMGAPWQTGIDDIHEFAKKLGFEVKTNFLIASYINQKFPVFKTDEKLLDDYSICMLSSSKK